MVIKYLLHGNCGSVYSKFMSDLVNSVNWNAGHWTELSIQLSIHRSDIPSNVQEAYAPIQITRELSFVLTMNDYHTVVSFIFTKQMKFLVYIN